MTRKTSIEISKKQAQVLECIKQYSKEKGYSPTVREICSLLNLSSSSTVHAHLESLERKGYIKRDSMKSRSIILTHKGEEEQEETEKSSASTAQFRPQSFSKLIDLPLVGNVAAGQPILAEQNITDTITLPTDIVGDSPSFLLSVRGDSMIEIGINDGDYVVVKEQKVANNGDIVVAIVDDGATVKRFFKESDHIRLQPENSSMEPIITRDCSIAGKVVAVFRRL